MKKGVLIEMISYAFTILFLYTGISKLIDFNVFEAQIEESPILRPIAPFLAIALPTAEIVISITILIPRVRLQSLVAAMILMFFFTLYIFGILLFDKTLPCSCGGIISKLSWPEHIVVNCLFIGSAIAGIILQKKTKQQLATG